MLVSVRSIGILNMLDQVEGGPRFSFGANWMRFLGTLDDRRIADAERSLRGMLGYADLQGQTFLDIGSGSGLFSLAARRLGARVHSFDFDSQSVACAEELKHRYFPGDECWRIERGSALDVSYMRALGQFDVVYSWGVLHHTGAMWLGLANTIERVKPVGGLLFVAIYNDQGWRSHAWWFVKAFYNRLPHIVRRLFVSVLMGMIHLAAILRSTFKGKPMEAIRPLLDDSRERGMSARYDAVDWVGGFPFEVATFELLESYLSARGFRLCNSRRTKSWGCNELVLRRN